MTQFLPKPAIIAHRGSSAYAPENTLAAFRLALHQDADGIELDAKLTADNQVVVIHDQTVDRTTLSKGRVSDYKMVELKKMDAGSHFAISFRGESVPSLEEVLKTVGQFTITNIELTNYATPTDDLPDKVVELVQAYQLQERVLFSSFNPIALRRIHKLMPEAQIGLLASPKWAGKYIHLPNWLIYHDNLHIPLSDATPQLIRKIQRKGKKVFVYTVNKERDLIRLFEYGVDGVFSDDPLLAKDVRGRTMPLTK